MLDLVNEDLINYYNTPGDNINLINFCNEEKIDIKGISLKDFIEE